MTEDTLSMISDVRLDASEIIVEFTVSINSTEVAVVLNLIIHLILSFSLCKKLSSNLTVVYI